MKLSRRNKKKRRNRYGDLWHQLSSSSFYAQQKIASTEEINQIAFTVFGGLSVSSKDL
jgi:hypothetical protein